MQNKKSSNFVNVKNVQRFILPQLKFNNMSKFILQIFFICLSLFSFAQEKNGVTYKIISNPNNEDLESYIIALDKSNFECFRFENKSRVLDFTTGVSVEFFSYSNVENSGVNTLKKCFLSETTEVVKYELKLVNDRILIQAPYSTNLKRSYHAK